MGREEASRTTPFIPERTDTMPVAETFSFVGVTTAGKVDFAKRLRPAETIVPKFAVVREYARRVVNTDRTS